MCVTDGIHIVGMKGLGELSEYCIHKNCTKLYKSHFCLNHYCVGCVGYIPVFEISIMY